MLPFIKLLKKRVGTKSFLVWFNSQSTSYLPLRNQPLSQAVVVHAFSPNRSRWIPEDSLVYKATSRTARATLSHTEKPCVIPIPTKEINP